MDAATCCPPEFVAALYAHFGADSVRAGAELEAMDPGATAGNLGATVLVRPSSVAAVASALTLAAEYGVSVVPQGGRTGLSGGAATAPGELIVSLERLNRIVLLEPRSRTAIVEAGVTLDALDRALAPYDLCAGIDLGARGTATIGGMVATNAGGIDAFRYGTMRERVLGIEAVLSTGEVLDMLARVRKDNSGLPLRQLFIGSEGILGIITQVALNLIPVSGKRHTALVATVDADAAVRVLRTLEHAAGLTVVAAEVMSGNHVTLTMNELRIGLPVALDDSDLAVLFSVTSTSDDDAGEALEVTLAACADDGAVKDCLVPKHAGEERDLWRIREDWAVDRARPGGLWFDVSVPTEAVGNYLEELRLRLRAHDPSLAVFIVGHLADGNLHVTVNAPWPLTARYDEIAPLVYAGLKERGGSFSAEHGIGLEKRAALEHWAGPVQLALMRSVKKVFDPSGIMNRGKVLG